MTRRNRDIATYKEQIPGRKSRDQVLRYFSSKHAARYEFGSLSSLERTVLAHTIVTKDRRLAFVKNSKSGCSTVAHLLYLSDHDQSYEGNIHDTRLGLSADIESWEETRKCLHDSFSFSIVRNPVQRLVSAFYNFCVNRTNREAQKHLWMLKEYGLSSQNSMSDNFDCFIEYVEAGIKRSALTTDRHFRPQHINLGHGLIDLNYVGKIESLQFDLNRISELSGVALPSLSSIPKEKTNSSGRKTFSPSPEQVRHIEKLYQTDYDVYGY